jgi:methionyl-tRNA formyltransferase
LNFKMLEAPSTCKIHFYKINPRPSGATYQLISDHLLKSVDFVLVYSKYLIPSCIYEKFHAINFHPSVLPLYPGLNGFSKSISNKHLGYTAHLIDETIDCGQPLLSLEITPFPSSSKELVIQTSYRMCSLLTAKIIKLIRVNGLLGYKYSHHIASTLADLESIIA